VHYRFTFLVARKAWTAANRGHCAKGAELYLAQSMSNGIMTGFCKNEDCPTSNELLDYQNGDLSRQRAGEISKHTAACEFCSAEVEFYTHYPQAEGSVEPAEIPGPLYELAEALLKNRHSSSDSLNALLRENEDILADIR
jgi:hypothetical protein